MHLKVTGKTLSVNTVGTYDTAGSPPPKPKSKPRKKGKRPSK